MSSFSLFSIESRWFILVFDATGRTASCPIDSIIDPNTDYFLNISLKITDEFCSELKFCIDGITVYKKKFDDPFFVINNTLQVKGFYNKTAMGELHDFEFGIGFITMYTKQLDDVNRSKMYDYMKSYN